MERAKSSDSRFGSTRAKSRIVTLNMLQQSSREVWYGIVEFNVPLDTV